MGISDLIASFLQDSLDTAEDGVLEVQRSELAQRFNCVPSQINYVMSTRFSPERGYIVESRRGGNGYIRITRVRTDRKTLLMHVINSIGDTLDYASARAITVRWSAASRSPRSRRTPSPCRRRMGRPEREGGKTRPFLGELPGRTVISAVSRCSVVP